MGYHSPMADDGPILSLDALAARVPDGALLAVPPDYSGVAMAATRALVRRGVKRLWVGGLAQDVCVCATVLDARREGLEVQVIADATRPVSEAGGREALDQMRRAGAGLVETADR